MTADSPSLAVVRRLYAELQARRLTVDQLTAEMAKVPRARETVGNAEMIAAIELHCAYGLACADLLRAIELCRHIPRPESRQ